MVFINRYIEKEDYYEIYVNNSKSVFIIDKDDFKYIKERTWWSNKRIVNGKTFEYMISKDEYGNKIKFHDMIMDFPNKKDKRFIVDHIDGNTLNNKKSNLRIRTQSENNMNKTIQRNNISGIVGVSWHKKDKMWSCRISLNNNTINLGEFYYLRNAVRRRIEAENKYFGEHAFINRDEKYRNKINNILNMPNVEEPYFYKICFGKEKITLNISKPCKKIRIIKIFKTKEEVYNFIDEFSNNNYVIKKEDKKEKLV